MTATRGVLAGGVAGGDLGLVLGEAALLTAVFGSLTVRLYRR